MPEWLKELAWKAGVGQKLTGGSNPPLSAILEIASARVRSDEDGVVPEAGVAAVEGGGLRVPCKGAM